MQATARSLHPDRPLPGGSSGYGERRRSTNTERAGSGGGDGCDEIKVGKMTERREWGRSSDHSGDSGWEGPLWGGDAEPRGAEHCRSWGGPSGSGRGLCPHRATPGSQAQKGLGGT